MRYKFVTSSALCIAICASAALAGARYVAAGARGADALDQGPPSNFATLKADKSTTPAPGSFIVAAQKAPEAPAGQPAAGPVAQTTAVPASGPTAASDALLGDWRMTYLVGNETVVLKIDKVSRGVIGAALSGALVGSDGKSCPLSGAIFENIAGMYPDGAKIVTMDVSGLMRVAAKCGGQTIAIDAFIVNDQQKYSGAGRATTLPAQAGKPATATIQLSR